MLTHSSVKSSDISVVIQGPTFYEELESSLFHQCIFSLRKYLPDAEIIISTWNGQPCDKDMVDTIIYSDEPKPIINITGQAWNFNKMALSTLNGLKKANRKYTLKFRADLCLTGIDLIVKPNRPVIDSQFKKYILTKEPIVSSNLYIRSPTSYAHLLFHPSDIVQFGLTEDLIDLWSTKYLHKEEIFIPLKWWSGFFYPYYTGERMVPEQALMVSWLNRRGFNINLPYAGFISAAYCELSEIILSSNFYVIDWKNAGVKFPERFLNSSDVLKNTIYDFNVFNQLIYDYRKILFSKKRYIKILYHVYIAKIFIIKSWVAFIATLIFFISPRLFLFLQQLWRKFRY